MGKWQAMRTTHGAETLPRYIILPQVRDFSRAVIDVLKCLESVWPELFPDKANFDWLSTDEFALPEEKEIENQIQRVISAATDEVKSKKEDLSRLRQENSFIRELLTATEDANEPGKRLSAVC